MMVITFFSYEKLFFRTCCSRKLTFLLIFFIGNSYEKWGERFSKKCGVRIYSFQKMKKIYVRFGVSFGIRICISILIVLTGNTVFWADLVSIVKTLLEEEPQDWSLRIGGRWDGTPSLGSLF